MFFNLFRRKIKVTLIINELWIKLDEFKTCSVPRKGELIFYEKEKHYYEVLNVFHYIVSLGTQFCHVIVKGTIYLMEPVQKKS